MTLTIPPEIEIVANELSRNTGRTPDDLLLQALQAHFLPIPQDLQAEFDAWELAADQDIASMDADLEPTLIAAR